MINKFLILLKKYYVLIKKVKKKISIRSLAKLQNYNEFLVIMVA
jgi:hypothetical protein